MISILAASLLSPFFVELTPEIRTTYQPPGKIVEDRPMQATFARAGYDTGRFGLYNFDVSSLADRRADVHRHALYHTEYGVFGAYDCTNTGTDPEPIPPQPLGREMTVSQPRPSARGHSRVFRRETRRQHVESEPHTLTYAD